MKLSIIMPVYNERPNIQKIIQKVMAVPIEKELIIIDDYSSDGTREILQAINDEQIKVIFHNKNQGKGSCIRRALKFAQGDWVIIQDADLEYDPQDYLPLIKAAHQKDAKAVYGSRFLNRNYKSFHFLQLFANHFLTGLTNLLFAAHLTDMETCYKLIKNDLLQELNLKSDGFEIEPEITAKILKRRINIVEIPISYSVRNYKEGKKIRGQDGFLSLFALIKYYFKY